MAIFAFAERLPTSATLIVTIFEMSFSKVKSSQGKLQMALSWHKKYFSGKLVSKNFLGWIVRTQECCLVYSFRHQRLFSLDMQINFPRQIISSIKVLRSEIWFFYVCNLHIYQKKNCCWTFKLSKQCVSDMRGIKYHLCANLLKNTKMVISSW